MSEWTLTMSLRGPYGEQVQYSLPLDHSVAREIWKIDPPSFLEFVPGESALGVVATKIKAREYRKDMFVSEAKRLGLLLSETMEDSEGWHDQSRIEPARRALKRLPTR